MERNVLSAMIGCLLFPLEPERNYFKSLLPNRFCDTPLVCGRFALSGPATTSAVGWGDLKFSGLDGSCAWISLQLLVFMGPFAIDYCFVILSRLFNDVGLDTKAGAAKFELFSSWAISWLRSCCPNCRDFLRPTPRARPFKVLSSTIGLICYANGDLVGSIVEPSACFPWGWGDFIL